MNAKEVRFALAMPPMDDKRFSHTPGRNLKRSHEQQMAEYEKVVRQRWRALALVIKAKLEAVEAGITVFEEEFLAHFVLPGGKTLGKHVLPALEHTYQSGNVKGLLSHFAENTP